MAERYGGIGAFDKPVEMKPGRMAEAAGWSDLTGTKRADKPWLNGRPRVIFIGDMADTFQPGVSFEYLRDEVVANVTSKNGQRHIWMWLTKQAKRMAEFAAWLKAQGIEWPANLWPGVSVTNVDKTWRIEEMVKVPSDRRFISYEPAWGPVDFTRWTCRSQISLIIAGGESGRGAKNHPCDIEWLRKVLHVCQRDQVCGFIKQMGSYSIRGDEVGDSGLPLLVRFNHPKGGDMNEWPADLRIRQFPTIHNPLSTIH